MPAVAPHRGGRRFPRGSARTGSSRPRGDRPPPGGLILHRYDRALTTPHTEAA
ncbi:hypothetical protein [Streptomyces sp. NPDC096032]|uniref:hypothetical protein n=1 Tax=Streptomyces sp. NPDC096032 TaxID=3366070 RepID=UPI003812D6B3